MTPDSQQNGQVTDKSMQLYDLTALYDVFIVPECADTYCELLPAISKRPVESGSQRFDREPTTAGRLPIRLWKESVLTGGE